MYFVIYVGEILRNFNLGILFIRLGLGICLFMHGFHKILNSIGDVKSILVSSKLPEFLVYFVYLCEVVAPIMIILGIFSRVASCFVLCNCFVILYAYNGFLNLLDLTTIGGFKAEIVYLYICICLCLLFSGSGKFALRAD